ncbi:MAG: YceI family protein [Candidatus Krumholzibacteria bacterium]|nr:YceI family protein [Candidatus Krumholzibacteria bacterium]
MKSRNLFVCVFLVTGLSLAASALMVAAQPGSAAQGRWEGKIDPSNRAIEVIIDLMFAEGRWLGDVEIPGQSQQALPLDNVKVEGKSVSFAISKLPGNPTFEGTISDNGTALNGDYTQGPSKTNFELTRNDGTKPEVAEPNPFRYDIDPEHTQVGFAARHFTVSRVRGGFHKVSGHVIYDKDDRSKWAVEVTIDATTLSTNHERRDGHLKGDDFLKVDEFPEIVFKSTKISPDGDGFVAEGDLTIRGVTRTVSIPFAMVGPIKDPLGMSRIGVEGSLKIDRRDYGLTWNKTMETGGLLVGHEVSIDVNAEATQK